MTKTSGLRMGLIGLAMLGLWGCNALVASNTSNYAALRQTRSGRVTISGVLRSGVTGPVVQAQDFSAVSVGHSPFEASSPQRVVISGRLDPNKTIVEAGTVLPHVLTNVRWQTAEGQSLPDMPEVMYIRPANLGAVYEGEGQR